MASPAVKRPAPNVPPKTAPDHPTSDSTPEGALVGAGNGSTGSHVVTSSVSSSTDESMQLVAELPDTRRVVLYVDARYVCFAVLIADSSGGVSRHTAKK